MRTEMSRREAITVAVCIGAGLAGCSDLLGPSGDPRLDARPRQPSKTATAGTTDLNLESRRRALLYVPESYSVESPAPLILLFHGATGRATGPINLFRAQADALGIILLSCDASDYTWDAINGDFGVDLDFVNRALDAAFDHCNIDPRRISVEGFSDGASYAIALGRANGDLFSKVAAFSAGLLISVKEVGSPRIYMSHGTMDTVIPIGVGGKIASDLRSKGYDVVLKVFGGGHTVPDEVVSDASAWLMAENV